MKNSIKIILTSALYISCAAAFAQTNTNGTSGINQQNPGTGNTTVQPDPNGDKQAKPTVSPNQSNMKPKVKESGTINPGSQDSTRMKRNNSTVPPRTNRTMQNSQDSVNTHNQKMNNRDETSPASPVNPGQDSIH